MRIVELLLIAIGLAMDAFAVSLCLGLSMEKVTLKKAAVVGLYFGLFQAAMPVAGYFLGSQFAELITAYDHWVAFILLAIIGGKMVYEGFAPKAEVSEERSLGPKAMLPLALATSIDAMAVGVSFAFLQVDIVTAVLTIGLITLVLSMLGVKLGHTFGALLQSKAEIFGGAILVLMGTKILLEHLGIISF